MHERIIQSAIITYLRRVLPDALVHHSPNEGVRGGKSGLIDGQRKKAAGQVAGWPDIEVFLPSDAGLVLPVAGCDVGPPAILGIPRFGCAIGR